MIAQPRIVSASGIFGVTSSTARKQVVPHSRHPGVIEKGCPRRSQDHRVDDDDVDPGAGQLLGHDLNRLGRHEHPGLGCPTAKSAVTARI